MSLYNMVRAVVNPDLSHVFDVENKLQSMLAIDVVHVDELREYLEELGHDSRLAALRSLRPGHLRRMYDAVEGMWKLDLSHFVPPTHAAFRTVHHHGKNSLPAFTTFQKWFCQPAKDSDELWGLNDQALSPVTGPGYFVARQATDGRDEVDFDYLEVPPEAPAGWPPVQANEAGLNLSRFVYGGMVDRVRKVSDQVSIGRAFKGSKPMRAWFVLCRE